MTRDADRPVQTTLAERMPKRRTQAMTGIGQYTSEPHAGGSDPIDLVDGDLRLAAESLSVRWNPCLAVCRRALRG